jgi:hypothetical protein
MIEAKLDRVIALLEELVRRPALESKPELTPRMTLKPAPPAPNGRKSNLSDLTYADPQSQERARAASVQFAIDNQTVPWSEAHMRAVLEYERMVRDEYGEDAVLQLPWNRLPRGADAIR